MCEKINVQLVWRLMTQWLINSKKSCKSAVVSWMKSKCRCIVMKNNTFFPECVYEKESLIYSMHIHACKYTCAQELKSKKQMFLTYIHHSCWEFVGTFHWIYTNENLYIQTRGTVASKIEFKRKISNKWWINQHVCGYYLIDPKGINE